jgi:peptidoglycan/LPS O-acetylase OafA/YrhL
MRRFSTDGEPVAQFLAGGLFQLGPHSMSAESDQPTARRAGRFRSLDGLRGLAALVVVFHHLSLSLVSALSDVYLVPGTAPAPVGTAVWWATATPAGLLLAGPEAVLIFFVLSGMVVVLPVLNNRSFDWVAYYPQRLARLYLPVIASVALAAVWLQLSGPDPAGASSRWAAGASVDPSWRRILFAIDLLFGESSLNNPLWSLRWEVLFSLLLPVFVSAALLISRRWWLAIVGSWALVFVGTVAGSDTLALLPAFFGGSILAVKIGAIRQWTEQHQAGAIVRVGGAILLVASLLLLNLRWIVWARMPNVPRLLSLADSLQMLAALGIVFVAAFWPPLVRLLCTSWFQWLGRLSFSLYLVHVPIIIAVGAVVGRGHRVLVMLVGLAGSVFVAELFFRVVEGPAHRLSRFIGVESSRLVSAKAALMTDQQLADWPPACRRTPVAGADRSRGSAAH